MPRLGSKAAMVKLKKIGGSLYERWRVWFNPIIHEKSYQSIKKHVKIYLTRLFEPFLVGTAWLSSVRVVKCNIKLLNERNLYDKFHIDFLLKKLQHLPQFIEYCSYISNLTGGINPSVYFVIT